MYPRSSPILTCAPASTSGRNLPIDGAAASASAWVTLPWRAHAGTSASVETSAAPWPATGASWARCVNRSVMIVLGVGSWGLHLAAAALTASRCDTSRKDIDIDVNVKFLLRNRKFVSCYIDDSRWVGFAAGHIRFGEPVALRHDVVAPIGGSIREPGHTL